MTLLLDQALPGDVVRTYHIQIPTNPSQAALPVILVFHGGGQDVATIAAHWGVNPPDPVPPDLDDYLLVFPEADPTLPDEWVHFGTGDSAFPTHDLDFVRQLLQELTTRAYDTGSPDVPTVSADPSLAYAAGFSNGAGLTWQLLHSDLAASFRGFAAVGKVLDPEKVRHYRNQLAASGAEPRRLRWSTSTAPPTAAIGRPSPRRRCRRSRPCRSSPSRRCCGETDGRARRPRRPPRSSVAAPASPRWSCSCSPGRRRSSR